MEYKSGMREVCENTKRYMERGVFPSYIRKKQSFNFDPKRHLHSHTCCLSLEPPLDHVKNCRNYS